MKHGPKFFFNPEDGSSLCVISTKNKTFVGIAQCHDDDRDMMNEKTGCEIAYHRAIINSLKDRKNELSAKLSGLKEYYYTMNCSKYFKENDYPIRRLVSHMDMLSDDIAITKDLIKEEQDYLKTYMKNKADFYEKIRKNRQVNLDK